ncbi:uncharacterized protein BDR25DRAFT_307491 [Lindgomyces ingoldianus]|uniref:Uncharacterized protein n=1 Tax=Lindgomyces ingoldianus TaxID=673940 RepID=A0ACB6QAE5_9PLEO|nr:uncharacterized protein BDR25DRAFT_307491 [Lindgomyces ingoldianus]KAF2463871.1 hypothetical protein BDR25DRAFT_307491 [Lindgomyces ingoldianus]
MPLSGFIPHSDPLSCLRHYIMPSLIALSAAPLELLTYFSLHLLLYLLSVTARPNLL